MKNKVAYFGVFIALALIFSYVESLIPIHFAIPGIKLGLANLIVVVALYKMGPKEAFCLSVVRVILAGFLFGNMFSIVYSMAGCSLSVVAMSFLKRMQGFSIMGISIAGGVFHNLGQIIVAIIVVENFSIAYYFPVLMIAGIITGLIIGILANEMLKRLVSVDLKED